MILSNFDTLTPERKLELYDIYAKHTANYIMAEIKKLPPDIQLPVYEGLIAEMRTDILLG